MRNWEHMTTGVVDTTGRQSVVLPSSLPTAATVVARNTIHSAEIRAGVVVTVLVVKDDDTTPRIRSVNVEAEPGIELTLKDVAKPISHSDREHILEESLKTGRSMSWGPSSLNHAWLHEDSFDLANSRRKRRRMTPDFLKMVASRVESGADPKDLSDELFVSLSQAYRYIERAKDDGYLEGKER